MNIDGDEVVPETVSQTTEAEPKKKGGWPKGKPRTKAPEARTEPVREGVRTRKRKGGTLVDKFAVPDGAVPPGMSWEWKRETVYGAEDPAYAAFLRDQGWEPVDAARYPGAFMADGTKGAIRRDGQVLMERPIELTHEAQAEERQAAKQAVAIKEAQLTGSKEGEFQRHRDDGSSTVRINRTMERGGMEIE